MLAAAIVELFDHNAVIKVRDVKLDFIKAGQPVPHARQGVARPIDLDPTSDAQVYEAEHIETNVQPGEAPSTLWLSIQWHADETYERYAYSGRYQVMLLRDRA